jgi:hypothetical protein
VELPETVASGTAPVVVSISGVRSNGVSVELR